MHKVFAFLGVPASKLLALHTAMPRRPEQKAHIKLNFCTLHRHFPMLDFSALDFSVLALSVLALDNGATHVDHLLQHVTDGGTTVS